MKDNFKKSCWGAIAYHPTWDDCDHCANNEMKHEICINIDLEFSPINNAIICNNFDYIEQNIRESEKEENDFMNDVEASKYTGVAKQTLANWRHYGKGPHYYKLSGGPRGRIRYSKKDLDTYMKSRKVKINNG